MKKIRWCRENEKECEKIVKNAYKFYETKLNKDGILKYLAKLCNGISKKIKYKEDNLVSYIYDKIKYDTISINLDEYKLLKQSINSSIYCKDDILIKISDNCYHEIFIYQYCINRVNKGLFSKVSRSYKV